MKNGIGFEKSPYYEYEGDYINNKKDGEGRINFFLQKDKNGVYKGEFKDDKMHGKGLYTYDNNNIYYGNYEKGMMYGKRNIYKYADGSEYYGEFVDNHKEGQGKFKWKDGKVFEGPFVKGKMHGIGKMTVNNNTFDVEFVDGNLVKKNSNKN